MSLAFISHLNDAIRMNAQTMPQSQALLSIEGLRFIASLAIMFSHFAPYALGAEIFGGGLTIFVDLFFVISGIVITTAYGGRVATLPEYGLYMQRRLARLYPLHLATMLFYIIIALAAVAGLFALPNPQRYSWEQLPLYLTLTQAWFGNGEIAWNGVSWSISAELAVYLTFPLILALVGRGRWLGLACVAITLILVSILSNLVLGHEIYRLASKCSWLRALPSFAAGVWLANNKASLIAAPTRLWQIGLYGSSAILVLLLIGDGPEIGRWACAWIIVASAYACDLKSISTLPAAPFISRHGQLTYSLYLIHPMVATAWLSVVAPRLLHILPGNMWLAVFLGFLITFGLSILSYQIFEEPARRILGRPLFRVADSRKDAVI